MNAGFEDTIALLKKEQTFLLAGHIQPDGDSLGSILGMGLFLESIGKTVWMIGEPVPAMYAFLEGSARFVSHPPDSAAKAVFIALDCGDRERLSCRPVCPITVNIDHHTSNAGFGDINLVEPQTAATGEIVYRIITKLGENVSEPVAQALYTAIATDTGFFRFANTSHDCLRIAAELVDRGANPGKIAEMVHERKKFGTLKLLGRVLEQMERSADGKLAWISVSQRSLKQFETDLDEIEGFVNYTRQIDGVQLGVLFKESPDGAVRVSIRSDANWEANALAAMFGGGGHPRAAGCTLRGTLAGAKKRFLEKALHWMAEKRVKPTVL